ncbi:MAG: ATP-dependent endonuclease [Nitrospirota bacterium]
MKLEMLQIENFRACKNVSILFDNYTCMVGPNGSGKSTVLTALNVLFRNTSDSGTDILNLTEEDYFNKDTGKPIIITATFGNLSDEAKKDLKHYVRQDELIIKAKAEWNPDSLTAEVRQLGARNVIMDFASYFEANERSAKANELKAIYSGIREKYSDLPAVTTKGDMESALRDYEESHPEICEPIDSKARFYGYTGGENLMSKYFKWIYIPAVKDASSEQDEAKNTALGELLKRTIRTKVKFDDTVKELREMASKKYIEIIEGQQDTLNSISSSLEKKLQEWAHPGAKVKMKWNLDPSKSIKIEEPLAKADIGEGDFMGEVARMGHGMQRAFIVTVLHELATSDQEAEPSLLLGFEEPELYQHPPQARHLSTILEKLTDSNSNVLVSTHSPYFVSGKGFEAVRMVRKKDGSGESNISQFTFDDMSKMIAGAIGGEPQHPSSLMATVEQIMQPTINELFFSNFPVLVEGVEDVAFISTYLQLTGKWEDFRKLGGHFIICNGKTNLSRPLAICNGLSVPCFVIFDGDCHNSADNNIRDNRCVLNLSGLTSIEPLQPESYWDSKLVMWHKDMRDAVRSEIGNEVWDNAQQEMSEKYKYHDVSNKKKNAMIIAAIIEHLWTKGEKSATLERLCSEIIGYGNSLRT